MKHAILVLAATLLYGLSFGQRVSNKEDWSELPKSIDPGNSLTPPSDAIVLFNGKNLDEWVSKDDDRPGWVVKDGILEVVPGTGDIFTKSTFGDVQVHVEWMIPEKNYGHGNSGIYLQGRYEVQIFNSYKDASEIYYNGQTGSLYKQHAPLVNASKPRGEWDSFDIIFTAPRFSNNGSLVSPAKFTVFHNGVLIQYNAELKGTTTHEKTTAYEPHPLRQPLMIQDHGDQVLFRNIWIREL
jgi:hypothetical protein